MRPTRIGSFEKGHLRMWDPDPDASHVSTVFLLRVTNSARSCVATRLRVSDSKTSTDPSIVESTVPHNRGTLKLHVGNAAALTRTLSGRLEAERLVSHESLFAMHNNTYCDLLIQVRLARAAIANQDSRLFPWDTWKSPLGSTSSPNG